MANKLQRKLLWQMLKENGRALFLTGRKSTEWGDSLKSGGAIVRCSECVLMGLTSNRWISKETEIYSRETKDHMYKITEAGKRAAGREEPEMKSQTGAHGPRWY